MRGLVRPSALVGTTMSMDRAQLIRRTAYFNATRRPKVVDEVDERYNKMAVQLFLMIRCMDYAMVDFGNALEDAGMLRHKAKRDFSLASKATLQVHCRVCSFFKELYPEQLRVFNDCGDRIYMAMDSDMKLSDVERSYNLMLCLGRLIKQRIALLESRYDFREAEILTKLPDRFSYLGIKDYGLDAIVKSYFK
jgi:hypothetical protein